MGLTIGGLFYPRPHIVATALRSPPTGTGYAYHLSRYRAARNGRGGSRSPQRLLWATVVSNRADVEA